LTSAVGIDEGLAERVEQFCEARGIKKKFLVSRAVEQYLDNQEQTDGGEQ